MPLPDPILRMARWALVGSMIGVSLGLWTLIPLGWVWLASQLGSSTQPSMSAYGVIIVGIPISFVALAWLLARLGRVHDRLMGIDRRREQRGWLKSLSGDRGSTHEVTLLDRVMIGTFSIALAAFFVWFFFFAGSSLPTQ